MENTTDLIVLSGEDGETFEVEVIDRVEVEGQEYFIVRPVEEEDVYTALRVDLDDDGNEVFTVVEDDEELNAVEEAYSLALIDEEEI
ncbi:DUF1292 domain-containing protein [Proteiniclasticum sp. QWL-01]|uniref:DUF1292 domain-containing protein n=1 Tax=Proteiniclasticum sp. QWL-01 TaxID=3036945 RepID=UPI00220074F4|nr:DUF1292 domain-containing protein [Proteiniclasticum sp. QWL-01]UUM12945.1 DUF1292 domain-containing protein [Clostridiaceae bacterium HFYG-1003]WFF74491.1 DUF1292 domain-containing protein [Proteiniclasticum sp. QWL-01]